MSSRRALLLAFTLLCVFLSQPVARAQQPLASLGEPSLSPDGREIAFVSGGDIWTAPAGGGVAQLLIAHPATESRPLYSPDGRYLAFVSTRTGNGDLYVLELATGTLRRLTYDDAYEQLDAWSADSKWLYFSSTSHDIAGMNDIYRVAASGGMPMPLTSDRYTNEFAAAPAPDGSALVFCARGNASSQWWRHGHSHLDETEIWKLQGTRYERLLPRGAKQLWPMWSADGRTLYFMSDRDGNENLWALDANGQTRQLTHFDSGRVLWPSIARDGRRIVFERNFAIWSFDLASGKAAQVEITLRGAPADAGSEHRTITDHIRELALSPDGKKIIFIAHGDLFAVSAKDGGDALRVTNTPGRESQVTWAPDNRRIAYVGDRDGRSHLYLYDFAEEKETQLTRGAHDDDAPMFSPDGKLLAFERDRRQIVVTDLATNKETAVATGLLDRPPLGSERPFDWSPDSRWIAYTAYGERLFRNAHVVPATGGPDHQIGFLSNVFSDTISWSPDGKFLLMDTSQRSEDGQVARIDLIARTPRFLEDQFRELFNREDRNAPKSQTRAQETDPARPEVARAETPTRPEDRKGNKATATQIVFEGIKQRLNLLPLGLNVRSQVISPDGKWLAFTASSAGQQNVYVYSLDELAKEPAVPKQLTATRGNKGAVQFAPDGKEIYYLDEGKINIVALDAPKPRPLPVKAELDVDFTREKTEAFEQGWRWLRDNFFDARMNGVDWEKTRRDYAPRIAGARTADEMRRVMSLMIGELNASHMGIAAPTEERKTSTGRLGLRFDREEYEKSGKLRVTEVVALGPAALAGISVGEFLTEVNGTPVDSTTNLDGLLDYRINRKTNLVVAKADGTGSRTVSLKPIDQTKEKGLRYREWVQANREYVERASGGRIGYVHMYDMSDNSLRQLFLDLDSENHGREGVIIDVRNNNGGYVNAYALDVLARRGYMTMTIRGFEPAPARTMLGQRSLERPTILVTNQHSLSDAEDFTEGYRSLGLGKVIGEPTAGWIIYTSNVSLIDGSQLRIPFTRILGADGSDMEMHPRPVDIEVVRALGEDVAHKDSQLDAAIRELTTTCDAVKKDRKPAGASAAK